jgi:hypothetical protein
MTAGNRIGDRADSGMFFLIVMASLWLSACGGGTFGPTNDLLIRGSHNAPGTEHLPARPTKFAQAAPISQERALVQYKKLPLSFEANQGQTDAQVAFFSRGQNFTVFLTPAGTVLRLCQSAASAHSLPRLASSFGADAVRSLDGQEQSPVESTALRMQFVGANPAPTVGGMDELPGKANYFMGNDPKKWRTDVPLYAKVQYRDIYPHTDVVYYGNQGRLEYDFVVGPGGDPNKVGLAVSADTLTPSPRRVGSPSPEHLKLHIDPSGDLLLEAHGHVVRYQKPIAYQQSPGGAQGQKRVVDVRYVLRSRNVFGFQAGRYDTSLPLVIDPVLVYSTYLAGSDQDQGRAIAVDSSGDAYITGFTDSPDFPTTAGAYQTSCGTDGTCNAGPQGPNPTNTTYDVFVTELNPAGSELVYSTFLGGSGTDVGQGIAVDASGSAYVTGYTESPDFPVTPGAFQTAFAPGIDPGVYEAGLSTDVCGAVYSHTIPNGAINGFVTKLGPAGNALAYSTFLGGSQSDQLDGIAVDSAGEAYVTGISTSHIDYQSVCTNPAGGLSTVYTFAYPTTSSAYLAAPLGPPNSQSPPWPPENYGAVFSKLSSDGSTLLYSTYLEGAGLGPYGGGAANYGLAIAVDSSGDAYLTGQTDSPTFPTTAGVVQPAIGGTVPAPNAELPNYDAFVSKFDPTQTGAASLIYSTYLGGPSNDYGYGIAVDASGDAYVTGVTSPALYVAPGDGFPTTAGSFEPTCPGLSGYAGCSGGSFGFLTELNPTASVMTYSTYLGGGEGFSDIYGIAVDSEGRANVVGYTNDPTFPTTANATQPSIPGQAAFVTTFKEDGSGLLFSTYFGGSILIGYGIALDNNDNIYITGSTIHGDIPTTSGAFQTSCAKCGTTNFSYGAFVAEISAPVATQTTPTINWPAPAAITYGTALGASQLDATASVAGTFVYTPAAGTVLSVGSQTLMVQFTPSDTTDYTVANYNVILTVNPAPLSVTASSASITYGGTVPAITAGYAGFVNGDTAASLRPAPTCTTTATSSSPVGSYPSTCSGAADPNYTISYTAGSVTVGTAPLTITAPSTTINAGSAIPTFSPTYSGFVNGQTASSLTTQPTCTTTATSSSPAGTYPINCSGSVDSNYSISYVPGTLTIINPGATLSSASLAFGNEALSAPSTAKKVTLTSSGTTNLFISSIVIGGANAGDFAETNTCPASLAHAAKCVIEVTFTPSVLGAETATLDVNDNASNSPQAVALTGTGVAPATLTPASGAFGNVAINTPSNAKSFTLRNNQETALDISSITFSNPDFTDTSACGSSLAAETSCTISVTFTPSVLAAESATMTVNTTAPAPYNALTASLSGTGVAQATVSPAALTFAKQKVGTTSAAKNVTLKNNLLTTLTISPTFTGADSDDFAQTNTCGGSLAAESTCTISVTFSPLATGTRTATLNVNDGANNSPQTVSLTGTGE